MKKSFLIILLAAPYLYGSATEEQHKRLDINGEPLKYTEVEVVNKAPFPITISWRETSRATKEEIDKLSNNLSAVEEKIKVITDLPFPEKNKVLQGTEWKELVHGNQVLNQDLKQKKEEAILIEHIVGPNSSKVLQLGASGLFDQQDSILRPKIQYQPSSYNEEYIISQPINLYQAYPIVISAESWADMFKNIYALDVIYSEDDKNKKLERFVLPHVGYGGINGRYGIFKHKSDITNLSPYY